MIHFKAIPHTGIVRYCLKNKLKACTDHEKEAQTMLSLLLRRYLVGGWNVVLK
ncbi:MAG: hypothetical protein IJT44_03125 [Clostridia bacterium]|nr:hypothetical protein [Clostridia bacterium]